MSRFLNSVSAIGVRIRSTLAAAAIIPALLFGSAPAVPTVSAVTSAVTAGVSSVASYAAPVAVAAVVALSADSAFAQTGGGGDEESENTFEEFPVFFDFKSLVTQSVAYVGKVGVIALGAVAAWGMIKGFFNFVVRRMRA